MHKFSLSPDIDENKIFLLGRGELGTQWSPNFYNKERLKYINIFSDKKYKFEIAKLKYIVEISSKKSTASQVDKYIGMANIDSNTGIYAESETEKGKGDCSVFKTGNVLFGKLRPYLNKVYLAEFDGGCTTEFVVLDAIEKEKISNKFLSIFLLLDCVVNQTKYMMTGNTLPRLQTFDIENLIIPIPPKDTQQTIIDIMDAAYETKKTKEAKAKELLDGIDDYLLHELGITLPPEPANTLDERTFEVCFADILGGRFDSKSYLIKSPLKTQKHPLVKLKTTADINPLTSFAHFEVDDEISFLPMEKISDIFGEAEAGISKRACESKGYTRFQENDLLWSKITPCMENGKSAVVKNLVKGYGFGSTEFHVFRARENLNIVYLHSLLRLKCLRDYAKLFFTGSAGHQRVDAEFFRTLEIPLPPIDTQNCIAEEIKGRRDKAKKLQTEAKEVLEQAKKEVEKIILGG